MKPINFAASKITFYAVLYRAMAKAARRNGYALGLHGSLSRDLDVIAVPWTEKASDARKLMIALTNAAGGFTHERPVQKPHRRIGFVIHLGSKDGGYVDVSVMPCFKVKNK
jgi:hypothetical protein